MKDLQYIKDEYAKEKVFDSWANLTFGGIKEIHLNEIAIRYAQEQNKELVEMLEIVIKDYENIIPQSPARDNRIQQIKELIGKHKN